MNKLRKIIIIGLAALIVVSGLPGSENWISRETAKSSTIQFLLPGLYGINRAVAQDSPESQIILTWQANNFYPADYKGKAAATLNSPISVSALMIKDEKIVDTSGNEFFWYLDNKFFNKGIGLDRINFNVEKLKGDSYSVRVRIEAGEERVEKIITIPVMEQELVIKNPRPSRFIKLGEVVELTAIPYFFNVNSFDDLSFFWSINSLNQKNQRSNRLILTDRVEMFKGADVLITGVVANRDNQMESARSNLNLSIR